MEQTVLAAALAGVLGTGGGGLAVFGRRKAWPLGAMLHFAAGVMLGMAFFDLLPEAMEQGGAWPAAAGLALGGLLTAAAEWIEGRGLAGERGTAAGLLLLLALALHNLPEGFAVGAAGQERLWVRAGLIGLHNIPGGMAAAFSLAQGGWSRWRAVGAAAASGLPLAVGAALGAALGAAPPWALCLCLAGAAGAMAFAAAFSLAQAERRGWAWLAVGLAAAWALGAIAW